MSGTRQQKQNCFDQNHKPQSPLQAGESDFRTLRCHSTFFIIYRVARLAGRPRLDFFQAVAGAGIEIKIIETLQFLNAFKGGWTEWRFSVEGMQDDALQQIAQGHVMVFGEGLQDFEQALLHANAGLHALHQQPWIIDHVYQCTRVTMYATDL